MEFRVHISVNVCKVRPIEYYLQRLPLPVSGWEWQLRENKIDLCDRRDQQPPTSKHILHRDEVTLFTRKTNPEVLSLHDQPYT